MTDTIRWGILGTGTVARAFAQDLRFAKGAELAAVGSRRQETADRFGDSFGIPFRHASYEALANDPSVDVVYIATPNSLHKEHTLLCLDAGKAVLCEKPFALNAAEARAMVTAARERGLFLMEAMWTRFIPLTVHLRELLAENALGEIRMLTADFGFRGDFEPEGILWNRAYGGGSLLDVGVYPVSFASMLFG
ncbi:MAG: hypothetical protein QG656_112, partial [Candidatus Hydrogenedentes bacterium]|nr:hypothetical protein [Candidatus Hydrogenedentota bacterium]